MNNKRNTTLEFFKLFASYAVVFIHVMFNGNLGVAVDAVARFAVPLFFLPSGFFSYNIPPEKITKRAKHILKLLIFGTVCYFFFGLLQPIINGSLKDVALYLFDYVNPILALRLLVFNKPVYSGHLWYLWAMLYVYVAFLLATRRGVKEKTIFKASFILLGIHILLGEVLSVFGVTIPNMIIRNFAFMGLPFFGLGLFVRKHENGICRIPTFVAVPAAATGAVLSLLSQHFFGKNELYTGSLFIVFAAVIVFVKHPNLKPYSLWEKADGCSTYIYIFHKMVSSFIISIYYLFHINYETTATVINVHPLIVCVATTVLAIIAAKAEKSISARKHKKSAEC